MFSTCSVLIVDDDTFARGIIRHHLGRLGIKNIFEADDGERALATLRSARMQLVIADRYMPNLNGLELFCGIQGDSSLKDTPFIMITMESCREKMEDALKLGIRHYLVKPFNAETFDQKIHKVLLEPVADSLEK
jgi:two-component system chemotaxis response regulator CheY